MYIYVYIHMSIYIYISYIYIHQLLKQKISVGILPVQLEILPQRLSWLAGTSRLPPFPSRWISWPPGGARHATRCALRVELTRRIMMLCEFS